MPPLRSPIRFPLVLLAVLATVLVSFAVRSQAEEDEKIALELGGAWIYEDLDAGIEQARDSGRPLLVTFR